MMAPVVKPKTALANNILKNAASSVKDRAEAVRFVAEGKADSPFPNNACTKTYFDLLNSNFDIYDVNEHFDWFLFPCHCRTEQKLNFDPTYYGDVFNGTSGTMFFYKFCEECKDIDASGLSLDGAPDIRMAVCKKAVDEWYKTDKAGNPGIRFGKVIQHLDYTLRSLGVELVGKTEDENYKTFLLQYVLFILGKIIEPNYENLKKELTQNKTLHDENYQNNVYHLLSIYKLLREDIVANNSDSIFSKISNFAVADHGFAQDKDLSSDAIKQRIHDFTLQYKDEFKGLGSTGGGGNAHKGPLPPSFPSFSQDQTIIGSPSGGFPIARLSLPSDSSSSVYKDNKIDTPFSSRNSKNLMQNKESGNDTDQKSLEIFDNAQDNNNNDKQQDKKKDSTWLYVCCFLAVAAIIILSVIGINQLLQGGSNGEGAKEVNNSVDKNLENSHSAIFPVV